MESFYQYLEKETEEEDWGVYVPTCGYQHVFPMDEYPLAGHPNTHYFKENHGRILPHCYLVYITIGRGELKTKHGDWEVNPGDIMILFPEDWHSYYPDESTGWEEYWIGFGGGLLEGRLMRDLFPEGKSYVKHIGYQDDLIWLFNRSLSLVKHNQYGFRKILSGIVMQITASILSYQIQENVNREEKLCSQVIVFIRENLNTEIDFSKLANEHHLSYNRFRTIFKNVTGVSLQQYLIRERLEKAKRLMVNTNLSLKEISGKTGFNSLFYFSKIFKSKMGYSPRQIRLNAETKKL